MARVRHNPGPVTPEEEQQIVADLKAGAGWHATAKKYHRCGSTIRAIAAKAGLSSGVRRWTAKEEQYLRDHYADTKTSTLAATLGRPLGKVYYKAKRMGLEKSEAYLASPDACRLRRGDNVGAAYRFKKGQAPPNKGLRRPGYAPGRMKETQFRKGQKPWLTMPIGATRKIDGYLYRKVSEIPNVPWMKNWRQEHYLIWEKEHGPIPAGHKVAFRNGDREDIRLENLELIAYAEAMRRNTIHNLPPELKEVIQLKGTLKSVITKKEKKANVDRTDRERAHDQRAAGASVRHD